MVGLPASQVLAATGPRQAFLDIRIGATPESPIVGRIVIELLDDVTAGSQRFYNLAEGAGGVDYRLSKIDTVVDGYIRDSGVRRMSGYSADERSPISGGDSLEALESELEGQTRSHDGSGLVSLVVRESTVRPIKDRLIARDGKFVTIQEQAGEAANGSSFVITRKAAPELDATNLIVGRVVSGMDVVERIGKLPVNKPRSDDPFFKVGKAVGDKRAVTAERAFNRPLVRVSVAESGVLS